MFITLGDGPTKISPMKNLHNLISHNIIDNEIYEKSHDIVIGLDDKDEEHSDSKLLKAWKDTDIPIPVVNKNRRGKNIGENISKPTGTSARRG